MGIMESSSDGWMIRDDPHERAGWSVKRASILWRGSGRRLAFDIHSTSGIMLANAGMLASRGLSRHSANKVHSRATSQNHRKLTGVYCTQ